MAGPPESSSRDLAQSLLELDRHTAGVRRLAAILRSPGARRACAALAAGPTPEAWPASPFGRRDCDLLWLAAETLGAELLRLDEQDVRTVCAQWTGSEKSAPYLAGLLLGPQGARALAARIADALELRRATAGVFAPEQAAALAVRAAALGDTLAAETRAVGTFGRERRARARAPLQVVSYGFGEMSHPVGLRRSTLAFADSIEPATLVYKRLAPFPSNAAAEQYLAAYDEYNRRVRDDVGIAVPPWGHRLLRRESQGIIVVCTQAALDPDSIGKAILLRREAAQCRVLLQLVFAEYRKLIRFNRENAGAGFAIGIDGQITNWAVQGYDPGALLSGRESLSYIDTNTPMMRRHGKDCLPIDFYLRAVPRLLRFILRPLARSVLDRYFDPRTIVLDFLANTSIHGRGDLLNPFLSDANAFLGEGLILPPPEPITARQVRRYIRSDVATWRLSRSARAIEEMLDGRHGLLATARRIHQIATRPIF